MFQSEIYLWSRYDYARNWLVIEYYIFHSNNIEIFHFIGQFSRSMRVPAMAWEVMLQKPNRG